MSVGAYRPVAPPTALIAARRIVQRRQQTPEGPHEPVNVIAVVVGVEGVLTRPARPTQMVKDAEAWGPCVVYVERKRRIERVADVCSMLSSRTSSSSSGMPLRHARVLSSGSLRPSRRTVAPQAGSWAALATPS